MEIYFFILQCLILNVTASVLRNDTESSDELSSDHKEQTNDPMIETGQIKVNLDEPEQENATNKSSNEIVDDIKQIKHEDVNATEIIQGLNITEINNINDVANTLTDNTKDFNKDLNETTTLNTLKLTEVKENENNNVENITEANIISIFNSTGFNSQEVKTSEPVKVLKSMDSVTDPNIVMIVNTGNIEDNAPVKDTVKIQSKSDITDTKTQENFNSIINKTIDKVILKISDIFDNPTENQDTKLFVVVNSGNIIRFKSTSESVDGDVSKEGIDNVEPAKISTRVKRDLTAVRFQDEKDGGGSNVTRSIAIDLNSNGLTNLAVLVKEKMNDTLNSIPNGSVQKIVDSAQLSRNDSRIVIDLGEFPIIEYPIPVKVHIILLIGR